MEVSRKDSTEVCFLTLFAGPNTVIFYTHHHNNYNNNNKFVERSRFQLFGDTVNTAARIESTGQRGRIHLSQECADLIMAAQKAHWVQPREDKVTAKGILVRAKVVD